MKNEKIKKTYNIPILSMFSIEIDCDRLVNDDKDSILKEVLDKHNEEESEDNDSLK